MSERWARARSCGGSRLCRHGGRRSAAGEVGAGNWALPHLECMRALARSAASTRWRVWPEAPWCSLFARRRRRWCGTTALGGTHVSVLFSPCIPSFRAPVCLQVKDGIRWAGSKTWNGIEYVGEALIDMIGKSLRDARALSALMRASALSRCPCDLLPTGWLTSSPPIGCNRSQRLSVPMGHRRALQAARAGVWIAILHSFALMQTRLLQGVF